MTCQNTTNDIVIGEKINIMSARTLLYYGVIDESSIYKCERQQMYGNQTFLRPSVVWAIVFFSIYCFKGIFSVICYSLNIIIIPTLTKYSPI